MNKILTFLFIGLTTLAYGQTQKESSNYLSNFNKKIELSVWLCTYDIVAWKTTDSLLVQNQKDLERLGREWFCFQKDNIWHAVYGKYENRKFDIVFHFKFDNEAKISKTTEAIDTTFLNRYSRALQTANSKVRPIIDSIGISFNQYIRENEDHTFSVWILPALQKNHLAVYGCEFIYTIDQTGTKILKDDSYFKNRFFTTKLDKSKELFMNYSDAEEPTLGAVFFALYYKSYFKGIIIEDAKNLYSPVERPEGLTWIYTTKETKQ